MSPFYCAAGSARRVSERCSADTEVGRLFSRGRPPLLAFAVMDGIHDLGGMVGFGKVEVEANEPVFHDRWEAHVHVLLGSLLGAGVGNTDKFRHAIELMPAKRYLRASYYERWLSAIETLLVEDGILTSEQIENRMRRILEGSDPDLDEPGPRARRQVPGGAKRSVDRRPKFSVGQRVKTRDVPSAGHTRLPRYARGKGGIIGEIYPAFVLPDSHAHDQGEQPQHVYSVLFNGAELWGEAGEPRTRVSLDLFETYLEPHDG